MTVSKMYIAETSSILDYNFISHNFYIICLEENTNDPPENFINCHGFKIIFIGKNFVTISVHCVKWLGFITYWSS